MSSSAVRLLEPLAYVQDITKRIGRAKQRVVLFTHIISYDESTEALVDALCSAAKRGVKVEVAGDVYTFGILGGYLSLPIFANERLRRLRTMQHKLKQAGVNYRWIGQFGPFLFAGRTHVKWGVVDDNFYGFGGVNLYKQGIEITDYMLHLRDAELAHRIEHEHDRIARADRNGRWYRSHRFPSTIGTVYIDGGKPFNSLIYDRACELAEQASSILYVSQYCPTAKLGKILAAKKARLYFSRWQLIGGANRLLIRISMAVTGYKTLYTRSVYNHAKYIIYTMPDGSRVALSGSHNFVHGGVILGTREIALETRDPSVIAQLENFFTTHIA